MAQQTKPSRPALAGDSRAPALRIRDLRTTLARLCEFMALGLVAVSLFLKYPSDLNRPNTPPISFDSVATVPLKAAFIAIHTRTPWIVMAVLSTIVAVLAYRARNSVKRSRLVILSPLAALLMMGAHVVALTYLQSQGVLKIETRGSVTLNPLEPGIQTQAITRITVTEGTATQWQLLFAGDALFAVPLLFAWVLSFTRRPSVTPIGGKTLMQ